jgi:hypothetical protein
VRGSNSRPSRDRAVIPVTGPRTFLATDRRRPSNHLHHGGVSATPGQQWPGTYLVQQIEEIARLAGHADIIREQIDGVSVGTIVLSQAGAPANDYFQPYIPGPGTKREVAPGRLARRWIRPTADPSIQKA